MLGIVTSTHDISPANGSCPHVVGVVSASNTALSLRRSASWSGERPHWFTRCTLAPIKTSNRDMCTWPSRTALRWCIAASEARS